MEAKCFRFKVDPFSEGMQTILTVASPDSIFIP